MRKKQFKAESKRLLDLMINSIYTHQEIFLREIISNASDAIDKLAYLSLTDDSVKTKRSDYRIYSKDGMKEVKFRHPDGGFRGWGAPFSVKMGSRTRYFWLTFDRHAGSSYEWSYGNLYCFELGR